MIENACIEQRERVNAYVQNMAKKVMISYIYFSKYMYI